MRAAWLVLPFLLVLPRSAQVVKLNDPLATESSGGVGSYVVTPDGTRVVFVGDLGAGAELHAVPVDGSAPPLELGSSMLNGQVKDYALTPDGAGVLFLQRMPDLTQRLYRLPVGGGTPLLLTTPEGLGLPEGGPPWLVDPASRRVVYRSQDTSGLFGVSLDGSSAPVRLSGAGGAGIDPLYQLTPDGSRVVYVQSDAEGRRDLFSALLDGSAPAVRLNLTRPEGDVSQFQVAFDSLGVVYLADQDLEDHFELYAVRVDGSQPPVKRSAAGGASVRDFRLASASDRLVYRAGTFGAAELYSVGAIAGGTPVRLNLPLSGGGVRDAAITADGDSVVYRADHGGVNYPGLFAVPSDGSAPAVELTPPSTSVDRYEIVRDTGLVLYEKVGRQLYSVPLDASRPAARLDDGPPLHKVALVSEVLADGTLLFTADLVAGEHWELFRVPLDGSAAPSQVGPRLPSGRVANQPGGTGDASRFLYCVDDELFSIANAGGAPRKLAGALEGAQAGDVTDFVLDIDGTHVAYVASEAPATEPEVCGVPSDGSRPALRLSAPAGGAVFDVRFVGERVLYQTAADIAILSSAPRATRGAAVRLAPEDEELFERFVSVHPGPSDAEVLVVTFAYGGSLSLSRVATDGSAAAQELAVPEPQTVVTSQPALLRLSPDGARLAYPEKDSHDLVVVLLDGSDLVLELDTNLWTGGGAVSVPSFTPDSARILYLRDSGTALRSVASDGTDAPVVLSAAGGLVRDYRIAPDGSRVVFLQEEPGDRYHGTLRSAPCDGFAPAVTLGPPLALPQFGVRVFFEIAPDASCVVFAGSEDFIVPSRLYSVALDGATPRRVLAAPEDPPFPDERGASLRFGAGGRVVFQSGDGGWSTQMWSVPFDGSAPALPLTGSPAEAHFQREYELTPDGSGLYYAGAQRASGVDELCLVPIDGSAPPRVLNAPLVTGGDVRRFEPTADGRRVLYLADQDEDEVVELYSVALLPRKARPSGTPSGSATR